MHQLAGQACLFLGQGGLTGVEPVQSAARLGGTTFTVLAPCDCSTMFVASQISEESIHTSLWVYSAPNGYV